MNRLEAANLNLKTYSTGKPCNKGHLAERYTSSGTCVACLKASADKIKAARTAKNTARFEGLVPFSVFVRTSQKDDVSRFCDVMRYGSPEIVEQTNAFVTLMRQQALGVKP